MNRQGRFDGGREGGKEGRPLFLISQRSALSPSADLTPPKQAKLHILTGVADTQLYILLLQHTAALVNQPSHSGGVEAYSGEHGSSAVAEEHLYEERIATSGGSARRGRGTLVVCGGAPVPETPVPLSSGAPVLLWAPLPRCLRHQCPCHGAPVLALPLHLC